MAESNSKTIFVAKNLADILYHLNSIAGLEVRGACTRDKNIGEKFVTVKNIPELSLIEKRERYIDFGSAVTLSQMISLGKNNMPSILFDALCSIGTPAIRNVATLGGNICAKGHKLTLFAPLLALDARLEFKNPSETKYIQMSKFNQAPEGYVLTKIRIPIDDWEVEVFKRTGPDCTINEYSNSFTFLADAQKDMLGDIRIAFCGKYNFRSKELENNLIGSRLPFSEERINGILQETVSTFERSVNLTPEDNMLKDLFYNLMHTSLEALS